MTDLEAMARFSVAHQPPHLAEITAHFRECAQHILGLLPPSAERTLAIRKLWEAKNHAVMARVLQGDVA